MLLDLLAMGTLLAYVHLAVNQHQAPLPSGLSEDKEDRYQFYSFHNGSPYCITHVQGRRLPQQKPHQLCLWQQKKISLDNSFKAKTGRRWGCTFYTAYWCVHKMSIVQMSKQWDADIGKVCILAHDGIALVTGSCSFETQMQSFTWRHSNLNTRDNT